MGTKEDMIRQGGGEGECMVLSCERGGTVLPQTSQKEGEEGKRLLPQIRINGEGERTCFTKEGRAKREKGEKKSVLPRRRGRTQLAHL